MISTTAFRRRRPSSTLLRIASLPMLSHTMFSESQCSPPSRSMLTENLEKSRSGRLDSSSSPSSERHRSVTALETLYQPVKERKIKMFKNINENVQETVCFVLFCFVLFCFVSSLTVVNKLCILKIKLQRILVFTVEQQTPNQNNKC